MHYIPIIALLENAIYVTYAGLHEVMVFAGQTPFNKLSTIKIDRMEAPYSMVADAARNAIYISDTKIAGLWLVNMEGEVKVTHGSLEQGGTPGHLSITPNGHLLVVAQRHRAMAYDGNLLYPDPDVDDLHKRFNLEIINLDDYSMMKFIRFQADTKLVSSAVRLADDNFVVCYSKCRNSAESDRSVDIYIGVMSSDGRRFIWMLDIGSIFPKLSHTIPVPYSIAINEDNSIFLADSSSHHLVLLDHEWIEFSSICHNLYRPFFPSRIVYRRKDRTLLVLNVPDGSEKPFTVSVLHLKENLGDQIVPDLGWACNTIERVTTESQLDHTKFPLAHCIPNMKHTISRVSVVRTRTILSPLL